MIRGQGVLGTMGMGLCSVFMGTVRGQERDQWDIMVMVGFDGAWCLMKWSMEGNKGGN